MAVSIKQLAVGGLDSNFSYLAADQESGEAFVVDPCGDVEILRRAVMESPKLKPKYILLTHGHHDHCSGLKDCRLFFDAPLAAHPDCQLKSDLKLIDRQILPLGKTGIECLFTPGHSKDSVTYHLTDDSAIFSGDTLFIDCCGYCEPGQMFKTMRQILWPLADSNEVYSGHDYGRVPHAPLGDEKRLNPYLRAIDIESFRRELKNL